MEENLQQNEMEHEHHSHTGIWIAWLILLGLLVLILAGVMVYVLNGSLDTEVDTYAFEARISELEDQLEDENAKKESMEEETELLARVDGAYNTPAFNYPLGYHILITDVKANEASPNLVRVYTMDDKPIFQCYACDGNKNSITMTIRHRDDLGLEEGESYIEGILAEATGSLSVIKDAEVSTVELANGKMGTITGQQSTISEPENYYDTEQVLFEGETYIIVIAWEDSGEEIDQEAWEVIKNSLDFSAIE